MTDINTKIKDLTEVEKLMIGSSLNFASNLISIQINHVENHDPQLTELIRTSQQAQEEFILLKNFKEIADTLTELFGESFEGYSGEDLHSLYSPAMKLESLFKSVFNAVNCSVEDETDKD